MKKWVKLGEYAEIKDKVAWLRKYSDRHFPLEGQPSLLQHAITLIDIIEKQREHIKRGRQYQTHKHDCQGGKGYLSAPGEIDVTDCTCGCDEFEQEGEKILKLTEE